MKSFSSRTRTGTDPAGSSALRPIRVVLTREKSKGSDSTTAGRSGANGVMRGTRRNTPSGYSADIPEMPDSPRVDIGPKSYKKYRNRERLVIRFYVMQQVHRYKGRYRRGGNYFVYDMTTDGRAGKTAKDGYADKEEAIAVAREYRDKYGAYARCPF